MAITEALAITESIKIETVPSGGVIQATDAITWDMAARSVCKSAAGDYNQDYAVIKTLTTTSGLTHTLPAVNYRYLLVWASAAVSLSYKVASGSTQTIKGTDFLFDVSSSAVNVLNTITVTATTDPTYIRVYAIPDPAAV